MAERLVVYPGGVAGHLAVAGTARAARLASELVVPGDVQLHEPVVLAGDRVQAGHVRVGAAAVDRLVVTPGQDMPVHAQQCLHRGAGAVPEGADDIASARADLGDVSDLGSVHRGKVAADISIGAIITVEGDGVDDPAATSAGADDIRGPRGNRVRSGRAEAESVVHGVDGGPLLDRREGTHRVHRAAALHELADLLNRTRRAELRSISRRVPHHARRGWAGQAR